MPTNLSTLKNKANNFVPKNAPQLALLVASAVVTAAVLAVKNQTGTTPSEDN